MPFLRLLDTSELQYEPLSPNESWKNGESFQKLLAYQKCNIQDSTFRNHCLTKRNIKAFLMFGKKHLDNHKTF